MKTTLAATAAMLVLLIAACGDDGDDGPLTSKEVFDIGEEQTVSIRGRVGDGYSGGTGVVYDAERGLVLTNAHVVNGLVGMKARFKDQPPVAARVRGSGFCDDLAVAQLTEIPEGVEEATFGDSDAVSNQDQVVALGYPASFQDFFTGSIVSTDGTVQSPSFENADLGPASPVYAELIQHSATINPGNSGGPLFNDRAELIGINTLKNHGTQGEVEGQFYAITSNHARALLGALESGNVTDDVGWDIDPFSQVPLSRVFPAIGYGTAEQGEQADMQLAQAGVDGLWVWGVTPGSPADKGEITGGDLITAVNGTPVRTIPDVCDVLKSASPGDTLGIDGLYIVSGPFGERWQTRVKLRK